MLVKNGRFGAALADYFATSKTSDKPDRPDEAVVLMRRHGFTCVADNLVTAVYRAIYTRINAEAQTKAMAIGAYVPGAGVAAVADLEALTPQQGEGCAVMCETYQDKPWRLWVREVERLPLYENALSAGKDST
jgi:ribulose-5-phosphate 4-epimerase/fuculose-1-phosphate aldolase